MKIDIKYLISFFVLFIIEIIIAIFVNDNIIRPYIGDILVVILMYTFIRIFLFKTIKFLPIYLFLFSLMIEISQYFNILSLFQLENNKLLHIIFGSTFDVKDILCYLVGSVIVFIYQLIESKYFYKPI